MTTARTRRYASWLACLTLLFGVIAPLASQGVRAALARTALPADDLCVSGAFRPATRTGDAGQNVPADSRTHGAGMCVLCTAGATPTTLPSHPLAFALVPQSGALRSIDQPRGTLPPAVPPGTSQPRAPPRFA